MKCKWCNRQCQGDYCSPECRSLYLRYEYRVEKYSVLFYVGVLAPFLLMLGSLFVGDPEAWFGLVLILEGVTFTLLPFGTPETCEAIGVEKTVDILRAVGLIFLVAGVALLLASLW